jgi:REP element-mobilizing transposase RayT
MPHSFACCHIHYVFTTKGRTSTLTPELRERLYPYIGGIARENGMKAVSTGGTADHVHILVSLPSTVSVAKGIQLIKGGSSKWIHDTFPEHRDIEWQEGYGGFSIGISQVPATIRYIEGQEEHHRKRTFQEEFVEFLKKHGVEYDSRYIWD